MARDDDDDDRPRKKNPDDDDDDDRPRKKKAADDGEDDDDRPRKKSKARDEEVEEKSVPSGGPRPMPMRLVGAIIATFAWGILTLHSGCLSTSRSIHGEIQLAKLKREQEERLRDLQKQMPGFNIKADAGERGDGSGLRYTLLGGKLVFLLMSVVLVAGGIVLLMRKGFGKFIAMGAPVGMLFVEFAAFVICLIISKWTFLTDYNVEFLINIFFSLVVGGTIAFLLLNKDVSRALK